MYIQERKSEKGNNLQDNHQNSYYTSERHAPFIRNHIVHILYS